MITKDIIKVKPLKVYLSATTSKCKYGQTYNLSDDKNGIVEIMRVNEVLKRWDVEFYNKLE